jgi:hypothetical protein
MDVCALCNKPMTYRKVFNKGWTDETKTCKEFEYITEHATCRGLRRKINKLKCELCDLEYKLFLLTYCGED